MKEKPHNSVGLFRISNTLFYKESQIVIYYLFRGFLCALHAAAIPKQETELA
mgnify:FL=1